MARIVEKSIPWVVLIAAVLCLVALIGAIVLLIIGHSVPDELWTILVAGFAFFLGGVRSKLPAEVDG